MRIYLVNHHYHPPQLIQYSLSFIFHCISILHHLTPRRRMSAGSKTAGDNINWYPWLELNLHYNYRSPLFYQALAVILSQLCTSKSIIRLSCRLPWADMDCWVIICKSINKYPNNCFGYTYLEMALVNQFIFLSN